MTDNTNMHCHSLLISLVMLNVGSIKTSHGN